MAEGETSPPAVEDDPVLLDCGDQDELPDTTEKLGKHEKGCHRVKLLNKALKKVFKAQSSLQKAMEQLAKQLIIYEIEEKHKHKKCKGKRDRSRSRSGSRSGSRGRKQRRASSSSSSSGSESDTESESEEKPVRSRGKRRSPKHRSRSSSRRHSRSRTRSHSRSRAHSKSRAKKHGRKRGHKNDRNRHGSRSHSRDGSCECRLNHSASRVPTGPGYFHHYRPMIPFVFPPPGPPCHGRACDRSRSRSNSRSGRKHAHKHHGHRRPSRFCSHSHHPAFPFMRQHGGGIPDLSNFADYYQGRRHDGGSRSRSRSASREFDFGPWMLRHWGEGCSRRNSWPRF